MTYQRIIYLKFKERIPTQKLMELYPEDKIRVQEVALLEVPLSILKAVIKEQRDFNRLMRLKRRFEKYLR